MPASKQLSANFSLEEFCVSAEHPELVVFPNAQHTARLERLAINVLQPIRNELGRSMRIISGYRSKALNDAVDGSVTSQHVRGEAADFTCDRILEAWLSVLRMVGDDRLPGAGQLIYYPSKAFIHCSVPSSRYSRPTTCVHWPKGGLHYAVISPTAAAFNAVVPQDQQRRLA